MSLPTKTREFQNHHMDSTMWNGFNFRDDDIIIATYAKSGTTWVQQIVSQLLFNGQEDLDVSDMSPWVDLRVPPKEVKMPVIEAQTHRRFLKTHLPVDALVFSEKAKYIYVGRDGRDVVWAFHHHHKHANDTWYGALNDSPGLVGPPIERPKENTIEYFKDWLEKDGYPFWPYWESIRTWWQIKDLPNVMLLHFSELKKDMPGKIREIAAFLDIPIDEDKFESIVEHCTFQYMKEHGQKAAPAGGIFWDGGSKTFINKGTNNRWRDVLPQEESDRYEKKAIEELGHECFEWLSQS